MTGTESRVVVSGAGVVCSIGCTLSEFANSLRTGRSGVVALPGDERTGMFRAAALLADSDLARL